MATCKQKSTNYQSCFWIVLIIFLALAGWRAYIKISNILLEREISSIQAETLSSQEKLAEYYKRPWFDKLLYVNELENSNISMPWSDHVDAILNIFGELLTKDDSDSPNIEFSDFKISLDEVSVHGYVSSLRILYQWSVYWDNKPLIEKFEDLWFLNNISIKTYEKSSDGFIGYEFILTANVINNGK